MKMLVAEASGLIGRATVRHFAAAPGWEVVGVSAESAHGLRHVTLMHGTKAYAVHTGVEVTPEMIPLRERGEPLYRPWPAGGPWRLSEAVDAALVAEAVGWAATADAARGETFNLTNGDVFTWDGVWPAIADALGMEPGGHRPVSYATEVRSWSAEWAALVGRHQLAAPRDLEAC